MKTRRFILTAFFVMMLHFSTPVSGQDSAGSSLFSGKPAIEYAPVFGLQAGSAFSSGIHGGSIFTNSLAPSLNWDISRRFSLQLGTILSSTQMHGMNHLFPYTPHMAGGEAVNTIEGHRMFSSTIYAVGAYQVNPRLTLIGSAWTERSNIPEMSMNPQAFDLNPRGAMFGFDYSVTENFRFGAEISVSSGYNPYNPFYNAGHMGRGFYNRYDFHSPAPFHRGSRW